MARYKNGINGPFSGRVGNVVGASWLGIDYMRSVAIPSKKPATQAQINQRIQFALVMNWLKPVISLINIGYQWLKKEKTAISYHLKEAVRREGAECQIDFANAVFSRGELLPSFIRKFIAMMDAVLCIKWDNVMTSSFSKDDDRATFIVYNTDKGKFVTFQNAAERADKEVQLQLPVNFQGDNLHCWMHYVNADGDKVSTSLYLGQVGG